MVTSIDQPQRRLHRWLRAVVLVLTAGMVVAGCGGSEPEGLEAASPGPDAVVGGDVVDVQLFYEELISEFGGSVTDPDGQVLDAEFVVDSTIQATIVLAEPLDTPGDHTVRHEVVAVDGTVVGDEYEFTYDPAAAPPRLIFVTEDSGSPWLLWIIIAVGVVAIGVLAVQLLAAMRRARAADTQMP